jgi:hypothetical protein
MEAVGVECSTVWFDRVPTRIKSTSIWKFSVGGNYNATNFDTTGELYFNRKRIEMLASNVRCHSSSVKDCRLKWSGLESEACKEIDKLFIS